MREGFINFLVCPDCKKPFKLIKRDVRGAEIVEGVLECTNCQKKYPITSGIPRIIPGKLEDVKIKTARNFGYEWKTFNKFYKEYQKQFEDWIKPLEPSFFKDKIVLDVGCGKGRHIYYSSVFRASEVVGVDLSDSIDVAYEQTKSLSNVHLLQADIYHLPLKEGVFDIIYSIGVIHHLPDPKAGFRTILQHVKPGGTIIVWMYGKEGNTLLPLLNFIRTNITLKMPLEAVKVASYMAMIFIHPVLKFFYRPLNEWKRTKDFAGNLPMNSFLYYLSNHTFIQNTSILFDQLIAPIANYYTKEEFESFFKENNLNNVRIEHRNNNSWTGVGVR